MRVVWLFVVCGLACTGEVVVDDPAGGDAGRRDVPATDAPGIDAPAADVNRPDSRPPDGCGSSLELEEFELTNAARAEAGVPPLICDAELAAVARAHSEDMCARDYFDHTNPDGDGPGQRVSNAGLPHRGIGENIAAGNMSPAATHAQWMGSSGHRRNILSEGYTRIGIGYASCGTGWPHLWTQVFASSN